MISASSRSLARGDLAHARFRPGRRLDQRLEAEPGARPEQAFDLDELLGDPPPSARRGSQRRRRRAASAPTSRSPQSLASGLMRTATAAAAPVYARSLEHLGRAPRPCDRPRPSPRGRSRPRPRRRPGPSRACARRSPGTDRRAARRRAHTSLTETTFSVRCASVRLPPPAAKVGRCGGDHGQASKGRVGGPYFEDFELGQVFDDAPGAHPHPGPRGAAPGARRRPPAPAARRRMLSAAVTGSRAPLAHPNLVCDVAIGQSTGPTQRVRGNLFYRGLVLQRPVFIGDTLRTRTEVVGAQAEPPARRRHRHRPGGAAHQHAQPARRAGARLLALPDDPAARRRPPGPATPTASRTSPRSSTCERCDGAVPAGLGLGAFRERVPGRALRRARRRGRSTRSRAGDTVTAAPELARLTPEHRAGAHRRRRQRARAPARLRRPHDRASPPRTRTRALPEPGHDRRLARAATTSARCSRATCSRTELHGRGACDRARRRRARRPARARRRRSRRRGRDPVLDWRFVGADGG